MLLRAKLPLSRQQLWIAGGGAALIVLAVVWWMVAHRNAAQLATAAITKLDQASSYHVRAELVASLPVRSATRARPFTKFTARVEGDAQENQNGTPELMGTVHSELTGSGARFFTNGDIRIAEAVTAFRLDELPVFFDPNRRLIKKWTHVQGRTLTTKNGNAIREALYPILRSATVVKKEELDGEKLTRVRLSPSSEQEQALTIALQHTASGNHAWNIVARALHAFDIRFFDLWIEPDSQEVRRIAAVFGAPSKQGKFIRRIVIDVRFSDFNKEVKFELPEKQLTVQPEVFRRLFNTGEITPQ